MITGFCMKEAFQDNLENLQGFESGVPGWDSKQKASIAVFLPHSCDLGQCFQLFFCCPL